MHKTVSFSDVELLVPKADRYQSLKSYLLKGWQAKSAMRAILKIDSFEAYEGQKICVVGRNGNGKTTFMKVLSNIYPATSGQVWTSSKPTAVLAAGIGLEEELSVIENIELSFILRNFKGKQLKNMTQEILEFCELENDPGKQFKHLSSGYRNRLAFAIATAENPRILVLDEVLGGGDEFFMKKARTKVHKSIKDAETAFVATHGPDEFRGILERLLIIENGMIKYDGNFEEGLRIYRGMYV